MLSELQIRDFAIIDQIDISLEHGLTTLTGETGAGKSLLLDALGLCLGDRADNAMVPERAVRSAISVCFSTHDSANARAWLAA